MMDITPIWIDGYYDTQAECASDMLAGCQLQGFKLEPVATPALTLDQIEAWLETYPSIGRAKADQVNYSAGYDDGRKDILDGLLAQVQAWKEGA
jgi:hypothetical protein